MQQCSSDCKRLLFCEYYSKFSFEYQYSYSTIFLNLPIRKFLFYKEPTTKSIYMWVSGAEGFRYTRYHSDPISLNTSLGQFNFRFLRKWAVLILRKANSAIFEFTLSQILFTLDCLALQIVPLPDIII